MACVNYKVYCAYTIITQEAQLSVVLSDDATKVWHLIPLKYGSSHVIGTSYFVYINAYAADTIHRRTIEYSQEVCRNWKQN